MTEQSERKKYSCLLARNSMSCYDSPSIYQLECLPDIHSLFWMVHCPPKKTQ